MSIPVLAAALAAASLLLAYRLEPVFMTQLTCHANTIVTDRVNKAVYNAFKENRDFQGIASGEDGNVSSLSVDMQKINMLKADAVIWVQDELNAITSDTIYIPAAAVLGVPLLSGSGFRIPVTVSPMTTVDAEYSESFESAGINQTRYRLDINIIVGVTYCCFNFSKTESITTSVPVVSTVISGNVPSYYGILSGTDAEIE
ncbi:MAG: sporulation protein YunB [bacterium]|nr:sporulation protein YunB [bacterium]